MNLRPLHAHDVVHLNPSYSQRISDERTMATPGDRFRAHDCAAFLPGQFHQSLHPFIKLRGLHVIGEPAERRIAPAHVQRIAPRVAQPSEFSQMYIADLCGSQFFRKDLPVKLRVMSRPRNTAYVYDALYLVRAQKTEKVLPCPIGVTDSQDYPPIGLDLPRCEYFFHNGPGQVVKVESPLFFSILICGTVRRSKTRRFPHYPFLLVRKSHCRTHSVFQSDLIR